MKKIIELNIVDKLVGYFSPAAAVNRIKARHVMALSGAYNAGSRSRPALRNWNPLAGDANDDALYELETIRARSRDLARNAPLGCAALNTVVTNTIGTGLTMQSNPDARLLGLSEDQANEWKREVEFEWNMWCSSLDCDASRSMDFYGLQSLAMRSMLESGDVIALTPAIKRAGRPYSLTIQLIEADRLMNRNGQRNTEKQIDGITLDSNGAPVKYTIANRHPGGYGSAANNWTDVDAYGKNGRRNVLHLFDRKRPGQVRGVPYLAPVIEHLKQLARYSDAELQAAVISAALAMFVKMDSDAFMTLFDDKSQGDYLNSATSWDGSINTNMDSPGKVVNLLPGEDIVTPDLGRPNDKFDPFFLAMLKQIGPALEIPFEILIKHFSSSYSASRAALLDFWRFVRVRRDFMATRFCEPIKDLFFEEAVSLGRIKAPGFFSDPAIRYAYTRVSWVGDSQGSIDPEKEVRAQRERIALSISTRKKEAIAFDGGDWEENISQLAKEKAMLDDAGITQEPQSPINTLPEQS